MKITLNHINNTQYKQLMLLLIDKLKRNDHEERNNHTVKHMIT